MKCTQCGGDTRSTQEDRELSLGLPYAVTLRDAPLQTCARCGSRYSGLSAPSATLLGLAEWIAARPGRLHPSEIRFLRNAMAWSQEQLGHRLGVASETISRWERAKKPMGHQSELALRFLLLGGRDVAEGLTREEALPERVDLYRNTATAVVS